MSVPPPSELTAQLSPVRHLLDLWRRQGRSPRRISDEIWDQAVAVAAIHGVGPVAKELHLDHSKLKSLLASKSKGPHTLAARNPESPVPAAFFELVAPTQTCNSLGPCTFSLESRSGRRMGVEVSSLDLSGLALLIREFVN